MYFHEKLKLFFSPIVLCCWITYFILQGGSVYLNAPFGGYIVWQVPESFGQDPEVDVTAEIG